MKSHLAAVLPALSAVWLSACSGTAPIPPGPEAKTLVVESLKYAERTLPSGLRVYAMPDANTANVSVQVWYDVGSKDDPPGRSGFAHLFEHIMFKATHNMPAETLDRLTEDVGGFNNASTWDDFTNYYEVVPANHLERVLWAEAERMGSLVVDESIFESERDVVKEEFRQRVLASPYGRLFGLYLSQANFSVHPYGRPGIGSIADLDAATIDDVRAFHAAYYRPDNAVLVVCGNFDQRQLDAWVDEYFASLTTPKTTIPRVTAKEPQRASPREFTVYEPNTPLPAVSISYPSPDSLSPDQATLSVLDSILSKGESSRLYQSMVYTQQVATEVFTSYEPTRDPGAYSLIAILSEGKPPEDGVQSLMVEIARMRDTAVTDAELDEAKNELVSETLEQRETAFGRATELANALIRYQDPSYADKLLDAIQTVTAADVQRVARSIFDDRRRVTIRYLSEEARPQDAKADVITTAATIEAKRLDIPPGEIPTHELAPEATRVKPPGAGPAVSARLPSPVDRMLANGLRVIVATKHDIPLLSANLRVMSGTSSDPTGRAGLAELAAEVRTKGTGTRSATEIARQIESLGASLEASAGADSSTVAIETRSDRAEDAFAIMADVVRNPAYAPEEIERQRQQTLDALSVDLRRPGSIASYAMSRVLFGDRAYGSVASPASVAAIERDEVAGFHSAHWRPDDAVLVISGDVSPDEGMRLAERFFGDWARPAAAPGNEPDVARFAGRRRSVVIDLPNSGQAAVSFGLRGLARTDADFFPALVANSILGGGYSARLNLEIRVKRGLSYGARSILSERLAPGPILATAQTRNDAAVQVVELMEAELARLGNEPASAAEIGARQANLIGQFGRTVETTSGIADQLTQLASFDLPLDRLQSFVADVSAVTPEQVQALAARLYDPKSASIVVVGDGSVFFPALKKSRPDMERVPIDELDLGTGTLQ